MGVPDTGAMTTELAADSDEVLLGIAMSGTAGHLERVVRATRRRQVDPLQPAALREVSWRWADDGSLFCVAGSPLPRVPDRRHRGTVAGDSFTRTR